jgi:hypothetical protein
MVSPAVRNSSGSLETISKDKFTPNTLNAVISKNIIGITDVKKKNTQAPATVVRRFSVINSKKERIAFFIR